MTGREKILERISQNKPKGIKLPGSFTIDDSRAGVELVEQFSENLKKAGAGIFSFDSEDELQKFIKSNFANPIDLENQQIKEKFAGFVSNEELGKTETVILNGQLGVAENGAIWIDEKNFPNRLLPFVTEQLIIRMGKNALVANMHEAYRRVDMKELAFGLFISGPSKTADIEQSLVYGAHGAKELLVLIF